MAFAVKQQQLQTSDGGGVCRLRGGHSGGGGVCRLRGTCGGDSGGGSCSVASNLT